MEKNRAGLAAYCGPAVAADKTLMLTRMRLSWLSFWGRVADRAGFPGIVREGQYASDYLGVNVCVRKSPLYTVVTVNGVDVYFYRLTGGIDGVSRAADCAAPEMSESTPSV